MKNAKYYAITEQLNCHHGEITLVEVWKSLPNSCENLPRNIIVDILNACNKAFHDGKKAQEREINDFLGNEWWKIK